MKKSLLQHFAIKSSLGAYDVFFEENGDFVKDLAKADNTFFVVDENVWKLYHDTSLKHLPHGRVIVQKVNEEMKSIRTACELYKKIIDLNMHRNATMVSIGGGILQDVTGFVASSIYRGINWILIPTTLLAQVDSCIGGKTAVNFERFKNLVGTFYHPSEVHIYADFIKTLSDDDYYSGLGEVAKMHLMSGGKATKEFEQALPLIMKRDLATLLNLSQNCLWLKKSYVEDDEFDKGKRNMLNYGHDFGHAIETATNFAVPHGQAIVLGMILANKAAVKRGILSTENEKYIREKILLPILLVKLPKMNARDIVGAMHQDKKNIGSNLALIMLTDDFKMVKATDVAEDEVRSLLETSCF